MFKCAIVVNGGMARPADEPFVPSENLSFDLDELPEHVDLVDLIDQPAWKTILLELVKKERMDPWAIDVADLSIKYLAKIREMESANLRVPANALLACAILVRLKARTIKLKSVQEIEDELVAAQETEKQKILLETEIPELGPVRPLRPGMLSLDELVNTIESVLSTGREKQQRSLLLEGEDVEFKVIASEENIEERMTEVLEKIKKRADSQGLVLFSRLVDEASPLAHIRAFVPLLFLMNKGEILAWQEEFWGQIFIRLIREEEKARIEN